MTHYQIMNFVGLTLEIFSRQINALKKEGVISFPGRKRLDVVDLIGLRNATGDDADEGIIV
tara:strand:+ start:1408 stop:1590 length:183 start_codon:yes stop_codon:yes gene_type:complete